MSKEQDKAFEELVAVSQELGLYDLDVNTMGYPKIEADCFDEARFKANCSILNLLAELVNKHKELRFGQILEIYGFVRDAKYTDDSVDLPFWRREIAVEPQVLVERVKKKIEELTK